MTAQKFRQTVVVKKNALQVGLIFELIFLTRVKSITKTICPPFSKAMPKTSVKVINHMNFDFGK